MPTYEEALKAITVFEDWIRDEFAVREKTCKKSLKNLTKTRVKFEREREEKIEDFLREMRDSVPFTADVSRDYLEELQADFYELDVWIDRIKAREQSTAAKLKEYQDLLALGKKMSVVHARLYEEALSILK